MSVITFPKILTERLTDEGAKALADIFNTVENSAQKITLEIAEERFEKRVAQAQSSLEVKIAEVKVEVAESSAGLKAEMHEGMGKLRAEIAESKAEIIKWMFIFWVGQFASIVGVLTAILFAFFKH